MRYADASVRIPLKTSFPDYQKPCIESCIILLVKMAGEKDLMDTMDIANTIRYS